MTIKKNISTWFCSGRYHFCASVCLSRPLTADLSFRGLKMKIYTSPKSTFFGHLDLVLGKLASLMTKVGHVLGKLIASSMKQVGNCLIVSYCTRSKFCWSKERGKVKAEIRSMKSDNPEAPGIRSWLFEHWIYPIYGFSWGKWMNMIRIQWI